MKKPLQSTTNKFGISVILFPFIDLIYSQFANHESVINNPLLSLLFTIIGGLIVYFRQKTTEPTSPIVKKKLFKNPLKK